MTDLTGVQWVRLTFVDVFGTPNAVHLPIDRFDDVVARGYPFDGSALEGRARHFESDMLLLPDLDTVTIVDEGIARVVCTTATIDGRTWPGDPRTVLASVIERLPELAELYRVSVELEFYVLDEAGTPADTGGYFDEHDGVGSTLCRAAIDFLGRAGIGVAGSHHEAGPGQYEIDFEPLPPCQLADALVLAKQAVKEAARRQGVRATFMPRPFSGLPGSGLHVHQRAGDLLFARDGTLTAEGRSFVAGQLAHASGLSALTAPTVNSYKRLHSGPEAPGAAVWAHANRAALIRVSSFRGADASIEYRAADPSANPYLLLAGLLAAGAHGVEADLALTAPVEEDTAGTDVIHDSVRYLPLPRDVDAALDALLADDVLVDALDAALLARLVDGRRAEAAAYRSHVTGWERETYLELA